MRVTDYELFDVPPRWILLRLETSDGTVGWGEVSLSRQRRAVHGAVAEYMEEFVLDEDPAPIEDRWQAMYRAGRFRGGPVLMTAIAGIDTALWDVKGRVHGLPIHELLGGRARERVRLYQHFGGEEPEELAADAREQVDAGFAALKTSIRGPLRRIEAPAAVAFERERMAAVREAVGPEVDVAIDFHGRASKAVAKRLAVALEEFDPMFYEEAVTGPEHADLFPELAATTSVPIATGERRHSRWAFKRLFEERSVDVVQPDICYAGGVSEVRRIAAMAEAYDVSVAPHCPFGPVALAACLQVDACTHNAVIQEQTVHRGYPGVDPLEYVETPAVFDHADGGYVDVPDGPGLGIAVDEDRVRERTAEEGSWESAEWRQADGAIAEW